MKLLVPSIELVCSKRGDQVRILIKQGRYLRVLFVDSQSSERSVGEFYFTPNDTTVQFHLASMDIAAGILSSSLRNMERGEMIRKQLRFLKLPVLRNRSRSLVFIESDFDMFGPGSAALGPPAEMTTGELEGRDEIGTQAKRQRKQRTGKQ